MASTTIRAPPGEADFTPLPDYQSQTPDTFFGGNPVLHHKASDVRCWIPRSQLGTLPVFPRDAAAPAAPPASPEAAVASSGAGEIIEQRLDVWVNSANLTLFNNAAQVGVTIPYPSVSIHALKTIGQGSAQVHGVWMQLELGSAAADDDDESEIAELTLVPPPLADGGDDAQAAAKLLFEAISTCSNLHPDPAEDEDADEDGGGDRIVFEPNPEFESVEGFTGVLRGAADGGLPPPVPGSSGWITAENVHEYFDEGGNWIGDGGAGDGDGELGDGAGRVRNREEAGEVNGGKDEDSDSKRPRVE